MSGVYGEAQSAMQEMTEKNLEIWQQMQDSFMKASGFENFVHKSEKEEED